MKIRIEVRHTDDENIIIETFEIGAGEYDSYQSPAPMLHCRIWELRNRVTNELIRRDRKAATQTIDSGSNTVQNTEE